MNELPNSTTPSPDGTTGLAMILGETRNELRHQTEETARRFGELHADLTEETAAREALDAENKEIIAGLTDVVQQLTAVVESLAPKKATQPVKGKTATPPSRARNQSNGDYHKRLVEWAGQKEITTEPPKPKGGEFANAYNKRIAEWAEANVSA
jgi:hypothetical protein